ncbi:helix-turn-helix transcriptional regulator [Shimia sp. CNT1-13L.2]|uniref:helix-turn-helix transcriptional regulator n=1 Tax=Shimia sp. CNT1-13L.2 TaxID=2959663 RepID=UPI0020CEA184|nr:helix-turn-helix transcriptional regulator [Shimia sp. CNT1-13L.2]MCP9483467.1 helix-turn-helix transcriptional regulator [Shimia sp. CNT1-13L.2]
MRDHSINLEDFSNLTTTLFSAAMGQVGWEHFLKELSVQAGDICTHLIGFDLEADLAIDFATIGYDPDFVKTYNEHFAALNAWAPGFISQPAGIPVDCEVMCPTEDLIETEFYQDWLRPQEDIIQGGGALLFKHDTRVFALGGNIRLKDAERLKKGWLKLVEHLIPHMQQAFEISRTLAGARLETAVVANQGLREVPGIVMISEVGRIVFANAIAQTMLARGAPVSSDIRGNLRISDRSEAGGQRMVLHLLSHRLTSANPSFSLRVSDAVSKSNFKLRFVKLTPEAQIAFPLDKSLGFSSHCTLLIISELKPSADLVSKLQIKHRLTKAEADVACMIAEGLSIRDISEQRHTSIHTVRYQVKAAMGKLDVDRQAQLVGAVQRLGSHSPFG